VEYIANKIFKVLDLSGYMFSGKAAVHDFLSEIKGFYVPGNRNEFDLLRIKDGIADLEGALTSWSPIRSDEAARRFLKVVKKISQNNYGIARLKNAGFEYSSRYPNILALSKDFIESITVAKWRMYWPYHLLEMNPFEIFFYKMKRKFFRAHNNLTYRLISREYFREQVKDYLNKLLSFNVDESLYHTIVINNAFEPFDPGRFVQYFHDAKCIVVDRDPRDIYVTANQYSQGFNDKVNVYRNIAGAFDVHLFINRLKLYREQVVPFVLPKILRISFEDIVLRYKETASKIYSFLCIDPKEHISKFKYFDPEKSKKNVGIYRNFGDAQAIRLIERELCDKK